MVREYRILRFQFPVTPKDDTKHALNDGVRYGQTNLHLPYRVSGALGDAVMAGQMQMHPASCKRRRAESMASGCNGICE